MAAKDPAVRTAIVLQGGGALGAYEFGVLKALYEQRPGFRPMVVSGTSIGAITAAVIGGARTDPISALDELWRQRLPVPSPAFTPLLDPTAWWPPRLRGSLSYLGNPGMYQLRPEFLLAPWLCTSVYDTAPLRRTLAELVDLDLLNRGDIQVIVGATELESGEARYFDSRKGLTFDHVLASASLPPGFPMTPVDGKACWDGGLFTNIPLSPAINALERADGGDREVVRELIVVELFPMRAPVPRSMQDVLDRVTQLRYSSKLTLDEKLFRKIGALVDLVHEVDEALPEDSPIRRSREFAKLREHRRIDHLHVVTAHLPPELARASDFSRSSIEARIEAGRRDALDQGIGELDPVRARR